jgi:outer membrane protein OmpA-like peptidoglycan-associated protein
MLDWVRHHASAKLFIEGHADAVGEDEYNVLLSYQRAKAVALLLEKSGIAPQQMQTSAMGSHGLIPGIPGHAEENRRVNVQIIDPDECRPQSE